MNLPAEKTLLRRTDSCYFQSFNSTQQAFFRSGDVMHACVFMNRSKFSAVKS